MYAVVDVAAYQFKVAEGEIIEAPKLDKEVGQSFDVSEVLLVVDGDKVKVGAPLVKGAKVTFEVVRQFRGEKDISFTYRKRKDTRKKIGHREELTALKVSKITA